MADDAAEPASDEEVDAELSTEEEDDERTSAELLLALATATEDELDAVTQMPPQSAPPALGSQESDGSSTHS